MESKRQEMRQEMADALRAMADDIVSGAIPMPYDISVTAFWKMTDDGNLGGMNTVDDARSAMAAVPGGWSKSLSGSYATYQKRYANHVTFGVSMDRGEVCRKVEVGTRHVEATEAHDEPVYDWVCDPE